MERASFFRTDSVYFDGPPAEASAKKRRPPSKAPRREPGLFLRLFENGYCPLPNADKACLLKGWSHVLVDARQVQLWERQQRWPAIGLRVQPPLLVADVDVADEALAQKIRRAIRRAVPEIGEGLERVGNPPKTAFFLRYDPGDELPFFKRQTRLWSYAPADKTAAKFRVEIFAGGGGAHQFGSFGPHSHDDAGNVLRTYHWIGGRSPATVPLKALPAIDSAAVYALCGEAESIFAKAPGLQVVQNSRRTRNGLRPEQVYDLDDDTVFEMADGRGFSLVELIEYRKNDWHRSAVARTMVTGSFTGDPHSSGSDRCLVSLNRSGGLVVHDLKTDKTHQERRFDPKRRFAGADFSAIAAALAQFNIE